MDPDRVENGSAVAIKVYYALRALQLVYIVSRIQLFSVGLMSRLKIHLTA